MQTTSGVLGDPLYMCWVQLEDKKQRQTKILAVFPLRIVFIDPVSVFNVWYLVYIERGVPHIRFVSNVRFRRNQITSSFHRGAKAWNFRARHILPSNFR